MCRQLSLPLLLHQPPALRLLSLQLVLGCLVRCWQVAWLQLAVQLSHAAGDLGPAGRQQVLASGGVPGAHLRLLHQHCGHVVGEQAALAGHHAAEVARVLALGHHVHQATCRQGRAGRASAPLLLQLFGHSRQEVCGNGLHSHTCTRQLVPVPVAHAAAA